MTVYVCIYIIHNKSQRLKHCLSLLDMDKLLVYIFLWLLYRFVSKQGTFKSNCLSSFSPIKLQFVGVYSIPYSQTHPNIIMIKIPSGTGWFLSFLWGYSATNPLVFKRGLICWKIHHSWTMFQQNPSTYSGFPSLPCLMIPLRSIPLINIHHHCCVTMINPYSPILTIIIHYIHPPSYISIHPINYHTISIYLP